MITDILTEPSPEEGRRKPYLVKRDGEAWIEFMPEFKWPSAKDLDSRTYVCGYCGSEVASSQGMGAHIANSQFSGMVGAHVTRAAHICPNCERVSYWEKDLGFTPGNSWGRPVKHLPDGVHQVYEDARKCMSVNAFSASIMLCRNLLMHIAVEQGASPNKSFNQYVEFLDEKGYIPPNGKAWVSVIREVGNAANHEIVNYERAQTEKILTFTAALLNFVYALPGELES